MYWSPSITVFQIHFTTNGLVLPCITHFVNYVHCPIYNHFVDAHTLIMVLQGIQIHPDILMVNHILYFIFCIIIPCNQVTIKMCNVTAFIINDSPVNGVIFKKCWFWIHIGNRTGIFWPIIIYWLVDFYANCVVYCVLIDRKGNNIENLVVFVYNIYLNVILKCPRRFLTCHWHTCVCHIEVKQSHTQEIKLNFTLCFHLKTWEVD